MPVLNLSEDSIAYETIRDWIHQTYGKPAGLLRDEYNVVINTDMPEDLIIGAGACVQILTRHYPMSNGTLNELFQSILVRAFRDYNLKEFLRSKALIRASDAAKWYSAAETGFFRKSARKDGLDTCTTRYITTLEVTDKKTKRSVRVEIEGSAFEARQKAIKLLYPDTEREEEKAALRRARRNTKSDDS